MKKLPLLALLLTFSLGTAQVQKNAELGVGAMGIVVSDIDASETFYKDLLGLTPIGGFSLDEQWSQEAGAANNLPFSVKQFKLQDTPGGTIIKLAYFEKTKKQTKPKGINKKSGVNYITLYYTSDAFYKAIERLKKADIELAGWVKREYYQIVFVQDPDGIYVELVAPPEK